MAYRAVFEKGTLDFNSSRKPTLALYPVGGGVQHPELPKAEVSSTVSGGNISDLGGYFNEVKYFVDCVEKGHEPAIVTPEDALASVELIQKEFKSAEQKLKKFGGA
jgi:predicted dehydrogenase